MTLVADALRYCGPLPFLPTPLPSEPPPPSPFHEEQSRQKPSPGGTGGTLARRDTRPLRALTDIDADQNLVMFMFWNTHILRRERQLKKNPQHHVHDTTFLPPSRPRGNASSLSQRRPFPQWNAEPVLRSQLFHSPGCCSRPRQWRDLCPSSEGRRI